MWGIYEENIESLTSPDEEEDQLNSTDLAEFSQ